MLSRRPLPLIAGLASLTTPALAQPLTGLYQWQVSRDGLSWTSALTLNPGDAYKVRGLVSWTDGVTASIGFAGCSFEQIDLINADISDIFGGAAGIGGSPAYTIRLQGVPETWSIQAGTSASASGLKIDNVTPTGRTNLGQIAYMPAGGIANPNFTRDNPATFLAFDAVAGNPKTLIISSTWTRLGTPPSNEFKIYTTVSGINKKPVQEAELTPAIITIIPAPATAALLVLAPAAAARRRRAP